MNCADMILDSVSVANLDEVNLSDMIVSGVNIPKFTWLEMGDFFRNKIDIWIFMSLNKYKV